MNTRRMMISLLLTVAVALLGAVPAGAYGLFTGANNCDQCHTEWTGSEHSLHSGSFSCDTCHDGAIGDNPVLTSTCVACHDAPDVFVLHAPLMDQQGYQCGYCHEGVANESHSWSSLKNIFE